ncbi:hypothetical protein LY76DRAFT_18574 [Colletotrichum caudatum]|nr:hypothetical protein LY76DRAFT_18574 [Colletotrichum caudatum]
MVPALPASTNGQTGRVTYQRQSQPSLNYGYPILVGGGGSIQDTHHTAGCYLEWTVTVLFAHGLPCRPVCLPCSTRYQGAAITPPIPAHQGHQARVRMYKGLDSTASGPLAQPAQPWFWKGVTRLSNADGDEAKTLAPFQFHRPDTDNGSPPGNKIGTLHRASSPNTVHIGAMHAWGGGGGGK